METTVMPAAAPFYGSFRAVSRKRVKQLQTA